MKEISLAQLKKGMARYLEGDRPWPERAKAIDWFIVAEGGELFPLKYTYGLAVDEKPALYTTNQMKRWLQPLNLSFVRITTHHSEEFEKAVAASLKDKKGRLKRLSSAPRIPRRGYVLQKVFLRNADVVAEVMDRAGGICERCGTPAPFISAKTKKPYLEVHHKKTLASGGEDTVENAEAVCPNCHRQAHHG
jgi:5-methylcytosine-specific restriction protein A